jgi:hypothetical protein
MLRFSFALAALIALPAAAPRAADAPLKPFKAEYAVSRNGSAIGQAHVVLAAGRDGVWEFTTITEGTKGLAGMVGAEINEVTRFRWVDGRPELVESRYEQKVAFKDRKRHISVDAAHGRVHSEHEKGSGDLAFSPNLIDRHGTVLALAADLARGAHEFTYTVADKQKVEPNVYRDAGPEDVQTPGGKYDTVRIERVRNKNPGRTTTSWLAPSLGYMPVRVMQREPDGETLDMQLTRVER